jgi:hypothetical protein
VSDAPLPKPDHLRDERVGWLAHNAAAAAALAIGVISFCVVAALQQQLWATPDWRTSVPGLGLAAAAAAISVARRERAYAMWMLGLGLAATAVVLGWVMMFILVIGVTLILIAVLHSIF